jgi:amino acid adenylation domain-containing protein
MVHTFSGRMLSGDQPLAPLPGGASANNRRVDDIHLPAEATNGLRSFATEQKLDLRSIIAGAWAILLSRYSGQEDVVFGIQYRQPEHSAQIHSFRVNTSGDLLLLPWLRQVAQTLSGHQALADAPVSVSGNTPSSTPRFETAVIFDGGETAARAPLEVHMDLSSGVLRIIADYEGAGFSEGTVPRILRHTRTVLENIVARASDRISTIPLMTDSESRDLVTDLNDTQTEIRGDVCVQRWFEEQVERTPDATAVIFHEERLSYRELNAKAGRLARRLRELGAGPDDIVAISVERTLEMLVGLLGILKSGAAYLPLDPAFPPERMQFMLEDSRAHILVTQEHLAPQFSATRVQVVTVSLPDGSPLPELQPSPVESHRLAYVIYTSGSTGRPKGVMIEHRQVSNFFAGMDQVIGPEPGVWLALTSISFDISVLELFWTLARGFTVVLQAESEKLAFMGEYSAASQIRKHRVTHLQCTPSLARLLIANRESLDSLRGLRKLMIGGEALPSALVARLQQAFSGEIFNLYGPTETTVWSAAHRVVENESVIPIGRPIANTQIYILDAHQKPVPHGAPGELYIGGSGVARGYLGQPELTEEKFLFDPFGSKPGKRMYRTGDLACYRPNGDIEFLGRMDNQVKILGFRIEPEEIEAILGQHPDVRAVAVVAREDVPGEKKLYAYIVSGERPISAAELRVYAQHRLPAHMVPSAMAIVDSLVYTPNRKIDKKAMAALPLPQANGESSAVTPASLERMITDVFREALELETLDIHDNFFDLGANSLVIAQLAATLQEALHREIPLTDLFKYSSVSALTTHLLQGSDAEASLQGSLERGQSRKEALKRRSRGQNGGRSEANLN